MRIIVVHGKGEGDANPPAPLHRRRYHTGMTDAGFWNAALEQAPALTLFVAALITTVMLFLRSNAKERERLDRIQERTEDRLAGLTRQSTKALQDNAAALARLSTLLENGRHEE